MPLSAGTRLGAYELVSALGAGGMGEVYRARDPRLNRDVAVKILPASFATDPERCRRFEQEGRAAAMLNHPNVLAVYDVGVQDGVSYVVSELLQGETLRARLARGAVAPAKAAEWGGQIARGLAAAHAKGLVHRDLKPENLFLTRDGHVKILDFGLAKPVVVAHQGDAALHSTRGFVTEPGVVMGTVAYMAPEQVRGQAVDCRADLFAFGAVLHEMLTGVPVFGRLTPADTAMAILNEDPPAVHAASGPLVSPLERIARRCLEKRCEDRFQTASDLAFALDAVSNPAGTPMAGTAAAVGGSAAAGRRLITWLVTTAIVLASLAFAWGTLRTPSHNEAGGEASLGTPLVNLTLRFPEGVRILETSHLAVSPDGARLAFAGTDVGDPAGRYLYVRSLSDPVPARLEGTRGAQFPFFSPDGRWLAFFTDRTLVKIPAAGGPVSVIGEVPGSGPAEWGRDGFIVFGISGDGLGRISAGGGHVEALTRRDAAAGETSHLTPAILPHGRGYLYTVRGVSPRGYTSMIVARGADGATVPLIADAFHPRLLDDGTVLFQRGSVLYAQLLAEDRFEMRGEATAVVDDVQPQPFEPAWSTGGSLLLYQPQAPQLRRLVWVRRDGTSEPVPAPLRPYGPLSLSPSGDRLITEIFETSGRVDAWILDRTRQSLTRATVDGLSRFPKWTPDGAAFTISHRRGGAVQDVLRIRADGSGEPEEIVRGDSGTWAYSWSADGQVLVYGRADPETNGDVWVKDFAHNQARPLVRTPAEEYGGELSPDGRWVAYCSNVSGQFELYITPFPEGGARWQVSTSGAREPRWARNGRELFFHSGNQLLSVDVAIDKAFPAGKPRVVFERRWTSVGGPGWHWYDVSPDGRFLMAEDVETDSSYLTIIQGWERLLSGKVPVTRR